MIRYYANKIVEDGLYDTETFSICVYFDEYKDEEFIKEHKEEISNLINLDEKVADIEIDENCFDMIFYLDYCPYYYEDEIEDKLNEQKEIDILNDFIKYIGEKEKYTFYTTVRAIVNEYIEDKNNFNEDEIEFLINKIKQISCESGFTDNNFSKYEVILDHKTVREFKFIINKHIEDLKEQEDQYSGYLSASVLRNLPQAVAIGNHDCSSASYQNHFNNPNPFLEESTPTPAGNGYFYSYGNALFIVINANNYNAADHKALIEKAIKENPNAKWRIVVMHQDIYGSGLDHSDSDGIILRTQLTPIFDANDIDVVLQGHDHSYARTYQLTSDGQAHDEFLEYKQDQGGFNHDNFDERFEKDGVFRAYYKSQNLCYNIADKSQGTVVNPEGVFYLTSNSATGSKFYNLIPEQQDYVAARSQNWRPSYSVINITKDSFTVNTYDVETGEAIDSSYTIVKK